MEPYAKSRSSPVLASLLLCPHQGSLGVFFVVVHLLLLSVVRKSFCLVTVYFQIWCMVHPKFLSVPNVLAISYGMTNYTLRLSVVTHAFYFGLGLLDTTLQLFTCKYYYIFK